MYCSLDCAGLPDLSLIQQEVDALEELSRQLFLETADLHATKVHGKELPRSSLKENVCYKKLKVVVVRC